MSFEQFAIFTVALVLGLALGCYGDLRAYRRLPLHVRMSIGAVFFAICIMGAGLAGYIGSANVAMLFVWAITMRLSVLVTRYVVFTYESMAISR